MLYMVEEVRRCWQYRYDAGAREYEAKGEEAADFDQREDAT